MDAHFMVCHTPMLILIHSESLLMSMASKMVSRTKAREQLERPDEDHSFYECKICGLTFNLDDEDGATQHVITQHKGEY